MKISQAGILLFISALIASVSGCGVINKVRARNELNDGAKAYKERKFEVAESKFRRAMELEPDQIVTEKLLAKTLHQQYLAKRDDPKNAAKAEQAIDIYKKILTQSPNDEETNRAVSNLIEFAKGQDALIDWTTKRANDTNVNNQNRASAFTSLSSKQYTCTNEITELAKENVVKDKLASYVFKKEKITDRFDQAKQCAARGTEFINKALELDQNNDSTWSYKSSFLIQSARIAEMEGNMPLSAQLMEESKIAKSKFMALSEEKARKKKEEADRLKAEEEAKK